MKRRSGVTTFSVGFVLFVATIVVVGGLFWVGAGQGVFARRVDYEVLFPSVSGLVQGSRVYLSGVPVGAVEDIGFTNNIKVNKVLVHLSVDESVQERIRRDSFVWLQTEGLLGDNTVHISMGTAGQSPMPAGSRLEFRQRSLLDDIAGDEITTNASDFLSRMIGILEEIQKGEGSLGQLLKNPELYSNLNHFVSSLDLLTRELQTLSKGMNGMISEIESQRGLLGKLIFSKEYDEKADRILEESTGLIREIEALARAAHEGKGTVGKLFAEDGLYHRVDEMVKRVSGVARTLDETLREARRQKSALARILEDGELGRDLSELARSLRQGAGSLQRVLEILERGEGSLGMVLHDPSLAASLRDVFLGVQELGYVKNIVRNAESIGREISIRDRLSGAAEVEESRTLRRRLEPPDAEAGVAGRDGGREHAGSGNPREGSVP